MTNKNLFVFLVMLLIGSLAADVLAAGAARVDFAVGEVAALHPDGRRQILSRGAEIRPGDTIDTGSGRAQLRFSDGALVSLQPQTRFRVDAYEFKGQNDGGGSEKGFFTLLKGALRTISGAIGKADRKAYRMDTTVATIGIRGTEYSVSVGEGTTVTTHSGRVEVCNAAGCVLVEAGQSAFVRDAKTKPEYTRRNALDPWLAPQGSGPGGFSAGDNPNLLNQSSQQSPAQAPMQAPPPPSQPPSFSLPD